MSAPVKIGIASCLLGNPVRWNGGHKRDRYIVNTLGPFVEFVPVCPESECGLGIPRETMHLRGDLDNPRLVTTKTGEDKTEQMVAWGRQRIKQMASEDLCGYIFKNRSPSNAMGGMKVFGPDNRIFYNSPGIFARMVMERFPHLPVIDDGRLHDPGLREQFIEQVFTMSRWNDIRRQRKTMGRLVDFHTRHKLLIMSHSPKHHREMGKLVASGKQMPATECYDTYEAMLVEALRLKTTVKKNANVLQHVMGYFKKQLAADEKQEVLEIIDQYRSGHVPLIVPITLMNHFVRKYDQPYLKQQVYLHPHPVELRLRTYI